MKRIKGAEEEEEEEEGSSSSSESPPEACKKVRTQTEEEAEDEAEEEEAAASETPETDWERLPQELLLHVFQYLPLLDRAYASQVCRRWNQAFHMPELWRCFEFELNQPASSYLKATHPDLIKQIIKRHSNHLQYVSFKVDSSTESAEAACDILSQLVNCSLKTLGLISTARPSFMEVPKSHFISALTVVFVNSKSLSSLKIDDTPVDDPSLKVLVANNSDTLKLLKMSSCPHVSPAGVSPPGSPAVTQSPDVSVLEGEAVSITCCWTLEFERIQVHWLKNQTEIKKEIFNLKNVSRGSLLNETSGCSHLNFTNVRREDSGRYICNVTVDIPALVKDAGNGTVIKVTANNTAGESSALQTPVIASLAVVASLLLIALVCFCCLRRRQARAARVIYEVPHIDSEEVDVDKHSTSSSTGSSQWCQVPVYESCDYFERVETKESG